jgi:steroid delta-isomerase-like uncharacterized protein
MSQSTQYTQNKQLASRGITEVIGGGNFDILDDVFAEDYVQHGGLVGDIHGSAALQEWFEGVHAGFSDFETREEMSLVDEDLVANLVTYSGTHDDGEFMGMPASGRSFETSVINIFRIEDGRISEAWVELDTADVLDQLGLTAPPAA